MVEHTYKMAGVDRDVAEDLKRRFASLAAETHGPHVLGGIGGFGALYELGSYREPVLVSSTDGVGTKLKIAAELNRYGGLGEDLVNACINDVIVCGARPLFFLDYLAMGTLEPEVAELLVAGMARACEEVGCALIGGETAELPGVYQDGDFDMAGFAVGVVEKSALLDGAGIREGDVLIGLPSNGLHTNGYSLMRHVLGLDEDPSPLHVYHPELEGTLGEALLTPHRSYYTSVRPILGLAKGIAHVTGGGLMDNVPRVLPEGLAARFDTAAWELPPVFTLIQEQSNIDRNEMYRVFNMGLGMVLICGPDTAAEVTALVEGATVVGEVVPQHGEDRVTL